MARTFSPAAFEDVTVVQLDLAPGAPSFALPSKYEAGSVNGALLLATKDFDGSALTGTNEVWVCGSYPDPDGIYPHESLGGQASIDAGYLKFTAPATPEMAAAGTPVLFSFPLTATPGGGVFRLQAFTSDGTQ